MQRNLFWFGWCSSCTSVQYNAEKQCNRDCSSCYLQGRIIYDNVLARQKCRLQCVQIKWCIDAQLLSAWQCFIHRMQQQGEEHWINAALQECWADQTIQCSPTMQCNISSLLYSPTALQQSYNCMELQEQRSLNRSMQDALGSRHNAIQSTSSNLILRQSLISKSKQSKFIRTFSQLVTCGDGNN